MEVFFNELSLKPECNSAEEAKQRIISLLQTLKELRKHDYRIMRTHNNFYIDELCPGYSFKNFFQDASVKRDLRELLLSVIANPYIQEDSEEESLYVLNKFETKAFDGEKVEPEGLSAAYIYGEPTISIESCGHWCQTPIELNITYQNGKESVAEIRNFWNIKSVSDWADQEINSIPLNTAENIRKIFPESKYKFEPRAIEEIIQWYYDDNRFQIRIKDLLFDIAKYPFVGGLGHTEVLKEKNGMASKRIQKKDRITYTYTNEQILIHQCKGHYKDT